VLPEIGTTLSRAADKRAIKAAIEAGINVPGAKLVTDKNTKVDPIVKTNF
jgi:hypothetical protein